MTKVKPINVVDETESDEFDSMRHLGFHLKNSQDGYAVQPDSSGTIGGTRGEQEYGFQTNTDALGRSSEPHDLESVDPDRLSGDLGQSPEPQDENDVINSADDRYLRAVIRARLDKNPHFMPIRYTIAVTNGEVLVRGEVRTDASKLLIEEVVNSIPGVLKLSNEVHVESERSSLPHV